MNNRRNFLKTSLLGAGAMAMSPYINAFGANKTGNSIPKRFVFLRFSNGLYPHRLAMKNLPENLKRKRNKSMN